LPVPTTAFKNLVARCWRLGSNGANFPLEIEDGGRRSFWKKNQTAISLQRVSQVALWCGPISIL